MGSNATLVGFLSNARFMFYGVTHNDSIEKPEDVPDYIQEATAFFFIFIIFELIYLTSTKRSHKFRINAALSSFSSGLLMKLLMVAVVNLDLHAYIWIHKNYRLINVPWNSAWAWWMCFIGVDLGYYWFHRMAHEVNIMWAAHQVHHSSEDYNLATALRQSAFQHCTSWLFYLPLALFIPSQMFVAHLQFNTLYQFWIHAAVVGKLGPLEWVLNTPSHHRVHHGRNRYCIDKNYAGTLIIWDRMFGTFEPEGDEVVYGLTHTVESFDPIYVQLCVFQYIWERLKNAKSWGERVSILFKGPGWEPGKPRTGLLEDIPDTRAPVTKYNPNISSTWTHFMFVHYIAIVICFQEFNLRVRDFSCISVALFIVFILLSLSAIGATLDKKNHAPLLHIVNNVLFIIGLLYSGPMTFLPAPHSQQIPIILSLYALISIMYWGYQFLCKKEITTTGKKSMKNSHKTK